MTERLIVLLIAIAFQAGCKSQGKAPANVSAANSVIAQRADSPNASSPSVSAASQETDPPTASAPAQYSDPPAAGVGPSVEQAYAAIPHRRTIWDESGSTVPSEEKEYLRTVFAVLDQAVRVRVAGQQAFSSERQYFVDWKSQGDRFAFGQQVGDHPGVRAASANLRAAYDELMSKYPNESQTNKDAFFDYHCALDFL